MPRVNGIEALRRIRAHSQIAGADADRPGRRCGTASSASSWARRLRAQTPRPRAVARLRAILRRSGSAGARAAAGPLSVGALVMWPQMRRAQWQGQPLALTSTEFNLLELLARNAGRVVGKPELSEQGWGGAGLLRPQHRQNLSSIRHKLGAAPGRPLVDRDGARAGYLMVPRVRAR